MTTINDIVTRSLKRLRVISSEEAASSQDASDVLAALNAMMLAGRNHGFDTNWKTKVLTDDFPLDGQHEQGVAAMLAVEVSEMFGKSVGQQLFQQSLDGRQSLQNDFGIIEDMTLDSALINMPSNARYYA